MIESNEKLQTDIVKNQASISERIDDVVTGKYPMYTFIDLGVKFVCQEAILIAISQVMIDLRNAGFDEEILRKIDENKCNLIMKFL